VKGGELAVVIGDGLVGQWHAQTLRARGCEVWVSGRHDRRLQIAREFSADRVIDTRTENLREEVYKRAPGGADIVTESAGWIANVREAVDLLRHDGQMVLSGYYQEGQHLLDIQWLQERETTVYAMAGWTMERMHGTLDAVVAGKLKVGALVTHEFPWQEAEQAYRLVWDNSSEFLGLVIRWK
jgi:bacteriochlorophyllide a dehydrogenase